MCTHVPSGERMSELKNFAEDQAQVGERIVHS
jgi:hypothetical protein